MESRKLFLDLDAGYSGIKCLNVTQYDVNVPIELELYLQGVTYEIPSGASVTIEGKKITSGDSFNYSDATFSGSTITFNTNAVMTDTFGDVVCKVVITYGTLIAGTANFVLKVTKAPVQADDVINSTGFESSVMQGIAQYASEHGLITLSCAATAAEMTDETKIYIYTGSESGYSNGHWYYFDSDTSTWTDGGEFLDGTLTLTIDSALDSSSTNAVQNRIIYSALADKANTYYFSSKSDFVTKASAMALHSSAVFLMANATAQALGFSYTAKGTIAKTTSDICDLIAMDGTSGFFVCRYTISTDTMTISEITGGTEITVDSALSSSSENPVQNKVIKTEVDSINASLTDLDGDVATVQSGLSSLQAEVTALGNGAPTAVSTVAEMTDTSIIYLYTGSEEGYTAGDWYYYNGSAWVDGGTYGTGRISTNGRNLLLNILRRIPYIDEETDTLITALGNELATAVITGYRSISFALVNVTSSENAQSVQYGDPFTCTLAVASGYAYIDSVTVTMGGEDITSSVYSSGTVTIPSVTGEVIITASAEWEIVADLTSNDLYTGRFIISSSPYYTTNTSSIQRVIYKEFDIPVEYGYTYKIEYTTTITGTTTNVGLNMYNENVLTLVASASAYTMDDVYDEGWLDNGATVTPPETVNGYAIAGTRISFRAGTGSTTITASNFPTVLLTRKAV